MEIHWSLMHPTPLDAAYFERVIEASRGMRVDGFEICGPCHGLQSGLDGLLDYRNYPEPSTGSAPPEISDARATLNRIVEMSHAAGKSVFYWHREAVAPECLLASTPGLLDENGEFDYFGDAYRVLLDYKIEEALRSCPGLDGIVLTLTEAQYAVIHSADEKRYPPGNVVEHICRCFASSLEKRGKRFVLRSFGSTPEDYEILLCGAEATAREFPFEVETKATAYDFIPFFGENPFLRQTPGCGLSVEFDGLGEFLGAGYFPAHGIQDLISRVASARKLSPQRYVLRMDRIGHSLLDASYAVKARIFERAVLDGPEAAREEFRAWVHRVAPESEAAFLELLDLGWRTTLQTLYVKGNLIFHTNPVAPRLKWLKAGGFFGVLGNAGSLAHMKGIWSILADKPAPSPEEILREKEDAVQLANRGAELLQKLKPLLDPELGIRLVREWSNLVPVARAVSDFTRFCLEMIAALRRGDSSTGIFRAQLREFQEAFGVGKIPVQPLDSDAIEHDLFATKPPPLSEAWIAPLASIMQQMISDYPIELRQKTALTSTKGILDCIVAGGISDDHRSGRAMHASHTIREQNRIGRVVGNRLFPNGTLDLNFRSSAATPVTFRMETAGNACPKVFAGDLRVQLVQGDHGTYTATLPGHALDEPLRIARDGGGNLVVFSAAILTAKADFPD